VFERVGRTSLPGSERANFINAVSMWLQIPQARLLIADSDGHQSLIQSSCAFEAQHRFLDDPSSVSATTRCLD